MIIKDSKRLFDTICNLSDIKVKENFLNKRQMYEFAEQIKIIYNYQNTSVGHIFQLKLLTDNSFYVMKTIELENINGKLYSNNDTMNYILLYPYQDELQTILKIYNIFYSNILLSKHINNKTKQNSIYTINNNSGEVHNKNITLLKKNNYKINNTIKNDTKIYEYKIIELADTDVDTYINSQNSDYFKKALIILFQVIYTYNFLKKKLPNFIHDDLKSNNIALKKTDKKFFEFKEINSNTKLFLNTNLLDNFYIKFFDYSNTSKNNTYISKCYNINEEHKTDVTSSYELITIIYELFLAKRVLKKIKKEIKNQYIKNIFTILITTFCESANIDKSQFIKVIYDLEKNEEINTIKREGIISENDNLIEDMYNFIISNDLIKGFIELNTNKPDDNDIFKIS
jgi:hypothetical protein